ncbi:YdcF family protein [uncultured Tateyamaria sp.]|uniref:YdcF family protein n=1 Tax=uncultured Tateyamaria sp. TaxID=455651 RepID=UPI002618B2F0|nr:YdcF family protein [uncultured Tateyamaria sp.]
MVLWDFHRIRSELGPADWAVALGSYDTTVATEAAKLRLQGTVEKILFTGHFGNWTRGTFDNTEAETFAAIAVAEGVQSDDVFLEKDATNIGENIDFSKRILGNSVSVVFVAKPQTMKRCFATVMKKWTGIDVQFWHPVRHQMV